MAKGNLLLRKSKKNATFAIEMDYEQLTQAIEQNGVIIDKEIHRFSATGVDLVFPYIILTLCTRGKAISLYDMQEFTQSKNQLGIIMPGHIMHPLSCTGDYTYARMIISPKLFNDIRLHLFSHDYSKFNASPVCTLTTQQAEQLLSIMDQIALITNYTEEEMPHRDSVLMAQLAVGYEFLNVYRREQDKYWAETQHNGLFNEFCELVVKHHRESKEVQFYAELLHMHPKYLTRLIRPLTHGMTPKEWIEQYVAAQAKRQIAGNPTRSFKQIAFSLGFNEPTSFYRYFKRVTGITAMEYRRQLTK